MTESTYLLVTLSCKKRFENLTLQYLFVLHSQVHCFIIFVTNINQSVLGRFQNLFSEMGPNSPVNIPQATSHARTRLSIWSKRCISYSGTFKHDLTPCEHDPVFWPHLTFREQKVFHQKSNWMLSRRGLTLTNLNIQSEQRIQPRKRKSEWSTIIYCNQVIIMTGRVVNNTMNIHHFFIF